MDSTMSIFYKNCIVSGEVDYYCLLCREAFTKQDQLSEHIEQIDHKTKLKSLTYLKKFQKHKIYKIDHIYYCKVCSEVINTTSSLRDHVEEDKHKANIETNGLPLESSEHGTELVKRQEETKLVLMCDLKLNNLQWHSVIRNKCWLCDKVIPNTNEIEEHLNSINHMIRLIQSKCHIYDIENAEYFREINEDKFYCFVCEKTSPMSSLTTHWAEKEHVDSLTQEKEQIDSLTQEKEQIDSLTQEKEHIDSLTQEKEHIDSLTQEKEHIDSLTQEKEHIDSLTQEKEHIDSLTQEKEHIDSLTQEKEHIGSLTREKEHIDSLTREKEQIGSLAQEKEHIGSLTREKEHIDSLTREKEQIGSLAREKEQIGSLTQEKEQIDSLAQEKEHIDSLTHTSLSLKSSPPKKKVLQDESQLLESHFALILQYYNVDEGSRKAVCKRCFECLPMKYAILVNHNNKHIAYYYESLMEEIEASNQEIDFGQYRANLAKFARKNFMRATHGGYRAFCLLCKVHLPVSKKKYMTHLLGLRHQGFLQIKGHSEWYMEKKKPTKCLIFSDYVKHVFPLPAKASLIINRLYLLDVLSFNLMIRIEIDKNIEKAYCYICDIDLRDEKEELNKHMEDETHKQICEDVTMVADFNNDFIRKIRDFEYHCGLCNELWSSYQSITEHVSTKEHKANKQFKVLPHGYSQILNGNVTETKIYAYLERLKNQDNK